MAMRFLWKTTATLMAATTAVVGGTAGATIITSDDPASTYKLWTNVPARLFRDSLTAASIAFGTPLFSLNYNDSVVCL